MKPTFLIILFIFLATLFVGAQSVTNVRFEKSGKQVVIYYDLSGEKGRTWDIAVYCNRDGGKTLGAALQKITGACGNAIMPGTNKKITWDVLAEIEKLEGEISFTVEATKNRDLVKEKVESVSPPLKKSISTPIYSPEYYKYKKSKTFWLVSALVAGGIGTYSYLQSATYHEQYHTATIDAADLYKKAQMYNLISPIAFTLAGFCSIEVIIKAGKQNKAKSILGFFPQPLYQGAGLSLVYKF